MSASVQEPVTSAFDGVREQFLAALEQLRAALGATARMPQGNEDATPDAQSDTGPNTPLLCLARDFGLSSLDVNVLLLCAGIELNSQIPSLCACLNGDERMPYPTFQLLLNTLPDATWEALQPSAPLRYWKLIEIGPGDSLTSARLRIEEPVLHALLGKPCVDDRLHALLEFAEPPRVLPASFRTLAERLVSLWRSSHGTRVAHLQGSAGRGKRDLAALACAAAGLRLASLRIHQLPSAPSERDLVHRLLERDATLCGFALLLDIEDTGPAEWTAASLLCDRFQGIVMISGSGRIELHNRSLTAIVINRPSASDQRALWGFALGDQAAQFNGELDRLSTQFSLDSETILAAGSEVRRRLESEDPLPSRSADILLEVCRADARPVLDSLAQRIEVRSGWNDIVVPDANLETLRAIAAQVRQRGTVLERWGFAAQSARGLGISALFHGPSGTGKTLAAEVLAHELQLDLFRIDLSQLVSKYIGETEKNLHSVFDAAENTCALLLFDEADALFGKRSEVRDSHDRYANIEVSYLLQRMETYRGLAILTTNLRAGMDTAFLRRIRFFVAFPFPDQSLRRRIWATMFPPGMPSEGLDFDKLARLNLPGGNIRNIALNAAYIAADRNEPVRMVHLLAATHRECAKLDRPLSDAEVSGWA